MQLQVVPLEYTANTDKKFYTRLPGEKTEVVAGCVPYSDRTMKGIIGELIFSYQEIIMGVKSVNASQLLVELKEKDAKIQDLTTKLRELEIAHSFMPSKPHLPKGYFSDLIDEDGLYD